MNSMKRQKDMTLDLLKLVGAQYANGEERRNSSKRKEEAEPKWKNTQLQMCLVIEARSSAVKSNLA